MKDGDCLTLNHCVLLMLCVEDWGFCMYKYQYKFIKMTDFTVHIQGRRRIEQSKIVLPPTLLFIKLHVILEAFSFKHLILDWTYGHVWYNLKWFISWRVLFKIWVDLYCTKSYFVFFTYSPCKHFKCLVHNLFEMS